MKYFLITFISLITLIIFISSPYKNDIKHIKVYANTVQNITQMQGNSTTIFDFKCNAKQK